LTDFFARVSFTATGGVVSSRSRTAHVRKKKVIKKLKRTGFCHYAKGITFSVLVCLALVTTALAQKPGTPEAGTKQKDSKPADAKTSAKLPYVVKVKTRPLINISVKADKAKMSEVAQELSKQLKVPVFLGPERQNELLTVEFYDLTLEPAVRLLSPTVYVDYEIQTGSGAPPKALGIFLFDANQGEPPLTAVVNGASQSMLIEGNTEDGVEPETDDEKKKVEEQPLRIEFKDNLLSVKAKKQPLPLVVLKIGDELGIPVDIQAQDIAVVDAEISKLPLEDVLRQLSPNIRLYIRADLTRAERRALRLVLAEPPKPTQEN
jgi:LAS superfamily LD-carboxypeptidase LdcB